MKHVRPTTHDSDRNTVLALPRSLRVRTMLLHRLIGSNIFNRFRRDESGSYLIISAIMMPVLLGLVGLGTDYGLWVHTRQKMQNAADAAAYSAAIAVTSGDSFATATTQADAVASSHDFLNGSKGVVVKVNQPPTQCTSTLCKNAANAVEVVIQQPQSRFFSALISSQNVVVTARAVAIPNGTGCVVALDKAASGAVTVQGSANVTLTGCALYDDSASGSALTAGGSSALSADTINVVGGISGGASISTTKTNGIVTGASEIGDPYTNVSSGPAGNCTVTNKLNINKNTTLSPGTYCGDLQITGGTVTLNPGIYYLDGANLSVSGGTTLTGTGVTLVFTGSGSSYGTANIAGGANVNLTAPTTGSTAGIVIFGDRNMTPGTVFSFLGGSSQIFKGAIDVPRGAVKWAGGAGNSNACTQLVADTITFTGTSNFAINCTGMGTKPIGSLATLVE
jgi:Flp pilus assembly protein TadG